MWGDPCQLLELTGMAFLFFQGLRPGACVCPVVGGPASLQTKQFPMEASLIETSSGPEAFVLTAHILPATLPWL